MFTRKGDNAPYERVPMVRAENGAYEGMLFDMSEGLEYVIEAAGVRSSSFNLKVVELPYVKQLDLEYHFPSYTGLAPRTIEDGGDVATLLGTDVQSPHPVDDGGEERTDRHARRARRAR